MTDSDRKADRQATQDTDEVLRKLVEAGKKMTAEEKRQQRIEYAIGCVANGDPEVERRLREATA